ncbi:TPA: glycohydrolase toxin TNT-related protein, partial [Streptococcus equi subsp. zooepidemicus]|nr:glycohydrolase toxin TNT-related protein [Streptococcus equi subsp. zooepidemicus]
MPDGKYAYLSNDIDKATGTPIPVRYRNYLKADGSINWPNYNGFSLDLKGRPIMTPAFLKTGDLLDRYGESGGTFTSPIINRKVIPFNKRGLPYPEDYQNYHQYKVLKDITMENVEKGYHNLSDSRKKELNLLMNRFDFSLVDIATPQKGMIDLVFGSGGG